jgi:hypothetical protein
MSELTVSRYGSLNLVSCTVLSILDVRGNIDTSKLLGLNKDTIILSIENGLRLWQRNQGNEAVWELGRQRDFEAKITTLKLGSDARRAYVGLQNGELYRCQIEDFASVKCESRPPLSLKVGSSPKESVALSEPALDNFDDLFDFNEDVSPVELLKDQQPPSLSNPRTKPEQFPVVQILLSPNDLDVICVHDFGKKRQYIRTVHFLNQPEYQGMSLCNNFFKKIIMTHTSFKGTQIVSTFRLKCVLAIMNQWDTADLTYWIHYFSTKEGNKSMDSMLFWSLSIKLIEIALPDSLVETVFLSIRPFLSPEFPVVSTSSIEQSFFRFLLQLYRYF